MNLIDILKDSLIQEAPDEKTIKQISKFKTLNDFRRIYPDFDKLLQKFTDRLCIQHFILHDK